MWSYNTAMRTALDLVGAATGLSYNLTCILVFVRRLAGRPGAGRAVGFAQACFIAPLVVLLATAPGLERRPLYYVQTALLLLFVAFEVIVDVVLRVDFRSTRWSLICYVMFFFAATGGMLGIAALAGQAWLIAGIATFLAMAGLSFAQRAVTGL
jgi:hypothetical protein